jgi:hypothetical protein
MQPREQPKFVKLHTDFSILPQRNSVTYLGPAAMEGVDVTFVVCDSLRGLIHLLSEFQSVPNLPEM